jgi:hypothetical protein
LPARQVLRANRRRRYCISRALEVPTRISAKPSGGRSGRRLGGGLSQ